MTARLLLDEHYGEAIAASLRERGHDVVAVVAHPDLRGAPDAEIFRWAAEERRRIVTENIKDFRPLLTAALASDVAPAGLLLVPPRRFPRGGGDRIAAIVRALDRWLGAATADTPLEDWLVAN
ncbi:MAG TPA: DUF5615 family PIN-like protein [Microbacterium sp.]|nr:DUF5615 family PIN-like protein [Microbacterium sp.]